MHHLFNPSDVSSEGLVEHAQDATAPQGLGFFHAKEGRPLATPWQVAVLRAQAVSKYPLPEGVVLDCACGSGIQLAAYASTLQRPVLGVELDQERARACRPLRPMLRPSLSFISTQPDPETAEPTHWKKCNRPCTRYSNRGRRTSHRHRKAQPCSSTSLRG